LPRSTRWPKTTTTAAATRPVVNVTVPTTTAFAASTRPRRGLAARVVRMSPRRYSAVMNMAPTTTTMTSPTNVPTSVWVMDAPMPAAPGTAGAMSPEPVTVNTSPACSKWPWRTGGAFPGVPMLSPFHTCRAASPGEPPCTERRSKVPVAWVGPPMAPDLNDSLTSSAYCGEVANNPASTVDGRPVSFAVPTVAHVVPSADSAPVTASPLRVSRSQRGASVLTPPGLPARSWV
jgi:hypothetical protein